MSTSVMRRRISEASPGFKARIAGAVYLLYFITAVAAESLISRKRVSFGDALNLIAYALYIVLTLLFYYLFKPVNRRLSLLAAVFGLLGCTVGVLEVFDLAPSRLSPLFFFGFYCLLIGYLTFRSTFLPRLLGSLMVLAGLGWLAFLVPVIAKTLSLYIEVLGIVAEASLMLWLLVKGVNDQRWKEQASATAAPIRA